MTTLRTLTPDDADVVEAYLASRPDTTIFLRGNIAEAGLEDGTARYAATYAGVFRGDALAGVAAVYRNGMLILETDADLAAALAAHAVEITERGVLGVIGSPALVEAARAGLRLPGQQVRSEGCEVLYRLLLDDLVVPEALAAGRWRGRSAVEADFDVLVPWSHDYMVEALGETPGDELMESARDGLVGRLAKDRLYVLEDEGELVSMTGFNAELPDVVQVGGVWTPPALRSRGYAGAAVAASLLARRAAGATRSILFTEVKNRPAQRCYERLGYEHIGDYQLMFLNAPWRP